MVEEVGEWDEALGVEGCEVLGAEHDFGDDETGC